jgi:hypothetical protein
MDALCITCREPLGADGVCPRCAAAPAGIRSRGVDIGDAARARHAIDELLEHRRRGLGRVIGIAGLPRHGKTKFADRLRERAAERPGADLRYDKTERGQVNLYYIPGRREHHVLVDVAGEDFQALGDYTRELPGLVRNFLWPVLQQLDGLLLMAALPIVWSAWSHASEDGRREPGEQDADEMRSATQRMVDAHRMLLKYAIVARDLRRLRRLLPHIGLDEHAAPTRNQIDDAFQSAAALKTPVFVGFSKADLYAPGEARRGLYTPDIPGFAAQTPPPLHPERTDPLVLGALHFPDLFEFLLERVRFFRFDFVQALEDRSPKPDPNIATTADSTIDTVVGAESILEFLTAHPWHLPGISTATAIRIDRRLRPARWQADAWRRLEGAAP